MSGISHDIAKYDWKSYISNMPDTEWEQHGGWSSVIVPPAVSGYGMSKFLFCNRVQFKATTNLQFIREEHKRKTLTFLNKGTVFCFVLLRETSWLLGATIQRTTWAESLGSLLTGRRGWCVWGESLDQSSYRVQKQSGVLELKGQMSDTTNGNKFLPTKGDTKGSDWFCMRFCKCWAGRMRAREAESLSFLVSLCTLFFTTNLRTLAGQLFERAAKNVQKNCSKIFSCLRSSQFIGDLHSLLPPNPVTWTLLWSTVEVFRKKSKLWMVWKWSVSSKWRSVISEVSIMIMLIKTAEQDRRERTKKLTALSQYYVFTSVMLPMFQPYQSVLI